MAQKLFSTGPESFAHWARAVASALGVCIVPCRHPHCGYPESLRREERKRDDRRRFGSNILR